MRKVCFILFSLYDFYSVKIQPRACSMPLSWTVVEYHSQSHWAMFPWSLLLRFLLIFCWIPGRSLFPTRSNVTNPRHGRYNI